MNKTQTQRKRVDIISTYIPIFRERLAKLEQRGRGHCEEAQKLRQTVAQAENESPLPALIKSGCSCLSKNRYVCSGQLIAI
jgi:hypothetical protein